MQKRVKQTWNEEKSCKSSSQGDATVLFLKLIFDCLTNWQKENRNSIEIVIIIKVSTAEADVFPLIKCCFYWCKYDVKIEHVIYHTERIAKTSRPTCNRYQIKFK